MEVQMNRIGRVAALAAALALASAFPAGAQTYPDRPITLVVPLAPGSTTDVTARLFARHAGETLGQQIVVENRPGAGSMVGSAYVAKAPPDGYTILLGVIGVAINQNLYKNVPFDPEKDFAPITLLVTAPMILLASPKLGVRTLAELREKYKDADLSFGSGGVGTLPHVAGELFKVKSGLKLRHVPYRGGAAALNDVIAGNVDLNFGTPVVRPHVEAGKVVALAVGAPKRLEVLPDVPTFAEAGLPIPELDFGAWFGLLAPAGTPKPVIDALHAHFTKAIKQPDVQTYLRKIGLQPTGNTPEEFAAFIREETKRWPPIFAAAGIQPK
jgi:tripartite-type tricarboxylate transporter receptor subunit TctC